MTVNEIAVSNGVLCRDSDVVRFGSRNRSLLRQLRYREYWTFGALNHAGCRRPEDPSSDRAKAGDTDENQVSVDVNRNARDSFGRVTRHDPCMNLP